MRRTKKNQTIKALAILVTILFSFTPKAASYEINDNELTSLCRIDISADNVACVAYCANDGLISIPDILEICQDDMVLIHE